MSRVDREFVADGKADEPDVAALLDRLAALNGGLDEVRRDAIVCLLSGSEGWREAANQLSGAFAADGGGGGRNVHASSRKETQE